MKGLRLLHTGVGVAGGGAWALMSQRQGLPQQTLQAYTVDLDALSL